MSFSEAINTPVLDFWWCLLWVSKPEWAALFALGGGVCVGKSFFEKKTSEVTLNNVT